jgi:hypothetical protein
MLDKDVTNYLRAAEQRLTSAEVLYKNDLYLDCIYIGGYVVECALKALILARIPKNNRLSYELDYFRGSVAHDYEYLKGLLNKQGIVKPREVIKPFQKIATWSTDLRYEVGRGNPKEADAFLISVKVILDWVKRSI